MSFYTTPQNAESPSVGGAGTGIFSESSPGNSDVYLPLRATLEIVLLYLLKKFYNPPEIL